MQRSGSDGVKEVRSVAQGGRGWNGHLVGREGSPPTLKCWYSRLVAVRRSPGMQLGADLWEPASRRLVRHDEVLRPPVLTSVGWLQVKGSA